MFYFESPWLKLAAHTLMKVCSVKQVESLVVLNINILAACFCGDTVSAQMHAPVWLDMTAEQRMCIMRM